MEAAIAVLTSAGPFGALVVIAGLYIAKLHKQLKEVQDARISDTQKVVDRVLAISKESHEAFGTLAGESNAALSRLTTSLDRLHTLVDSLRFRKSQ